MSRLAALFLLTFCAVLPWHGLPAQSSDEEVRIGILAKRGDERTLDRWRPTAQYLSQEIPGYRFSIVPLDFEAIGRVVSEGGIEFVLANSAIYVELEARYGAGRIATLRNRNGVRGYTQFGGVILARADRSDINTIADLRGLRFAAVKENSFGGYLMAWREMEDFGVTPARDTVLSFPGTHDAVVHAVLEGRVDAGTVRTRAMSWSCRTARSSSPAPSPSPARTRALGTPSISSRMSPKCAAPKRADASSAVPWSRRGRGC